MLTLTDENFDSEVATGVVLVKFSADWCGPCKMITPLLHELEETFKDKAKFASVDVDTTSLAQKFSIRGVPTVLILSDGQVVNTLVGAQTKSRYELALNATLVDA
jgi:thioredoxin 1